MMQGSAPTEFFSRALLSFPCIKMLWVATEVYSSMVQLVLAPTVGVAQASGKQGLFTFHRLLLKLKLHILVHRYGYDYTEVVGLS